MALLENNGLSTILCGLFLWQWVKSQRGSEKREEKLYCVIDTLSAEIPQIKDRLGMIETDLHEITLEVNKDG